MQTALLEEIGLTKGEIAVYLAMLGLGSVTVRPIVDKAKVSYSKIYDILERLINKGLVCFVIKENKRYFEAAPVERIMDYMQDKEKKVHNQKAQLKNLLPELKLKQQLAQYSSIATIYKGIKGLHTAFYSSIKKTNEIFMIEGAKSNTTNTFFKKFAKDAKKIKVISNNKSENIWKNVKYSPQITPATITIFGERVIIIPASKDITLFVIDSKEVADSFKIQFNNLWTQKVNTFQGIKQLRQLWMEKLDFGEYSGFGEGTKIVDALGKDFFINWQKEKEKLGIKGKVLIGKKFKNSITVKKSIAEFRFIDKYENPGITEVFSDRIIVVNFSKEPVAFVIEDKAVAQSHQTYFDLLWKQAKEL